jgi:hypothetical protein
MRIDRTVLISGMIAAVNRERERRQAAERAKAEAAWQELLAKLEEMGRRMLTVSVPGGRDRRNAELAQELVKAGNWQDIDVIRGVADLSPAEAVALCWTVDPQAAMQLLSEYGSDRN